MSEIVYPLLVMLTAIIILLARYYYCRKCCRATYRILVDIQKYINQQRSLAIQATSLNSNEVSTFAVRGNIEAYNQIDQKITQLVFINSKYLSFGNVPTKETHNT